MSAPSVTIIMPVRNEADYIKRSLTAILDQDFPLDQLEILIADGMSSDDTRDIIQDIATEHPQLTIKILDNPGQIVPTGMNIALREANHDFIIRIDGHCEIAPDYIRRCIEHLQENNVDVVGGSIETIGENLRSEAFALAMGSAFGVGNSAFRIGKDQAVLTDSVPFPAFTRSIIEKAGYYDEELVRNQDDEYNYRIRKLGGKILLSPDIHSRYYSRGSFGNLWRQYYQYGYWKVRVLQKHPFQMSLRQFVPPAFVSGLVVLSALSFIPNFRLLAIIGFLAYVTPNVMASLFIAKQHGWKYLPLLPPAFAILHISYGMGFLVGLFKFWNRWGDKTGNVGALQ